MLYLLNPLGFKGFLRIFYMFSVQLLFYSSKLFNPLQSASSQTLYDVIFLIPKIQSITNRHTNKWENVIQR